VSSPPTGEQRIVVVGAAGFTNVGDDAILTAMLDELRRELPEATFVVSCGDPDRLADEERVEPIAFDDDAVAAALHGAALLIVGGGGFIYDHDARLSPASFRRGESGNFYPYFRRAQLAYERGVPVHFYGVGVGPLITRGGRDLVRDVMSKAAAITVRDALSLHELAAAGVRFPRPELAADPAVRLPPADATWAERPEGTVVGFVVRSWAWVEERWTGSGRAAFDRYLDWVAAAADGAVERFGASPVFVATQRLFDDDRAVEEQVVARMRHAARATLHEPGSTAALQTVLGGLDALVSSRLHPLILAASAGTPVVGISAKPKVRAFLCSVGLPELVLSPWAASPRALAAALERVLTEPDEVRARLEQGMAAQRAAAARNPATAAATLRRA
jgi:L-malate glycosyltransferase